jgi:ribosomal protein L40E
VQARVPVLASTQHEEDRGADCDHRTGPNPRGAMISAGGQIIWLRRAKREYGRRRAVIGRYCSNVSRGPRRVEPTSRAVSSKATETPSQVGPVPIRGSIGRSVMTTANRPRSGPEPSAEPSGTEQRLPTRVCRKCSTQSQTTAELCPNCGARFVRRLFWGPLRL